MPQFPFSRALVALAPLVLVPAFLCAVERGAYAQATREPSSRAGRNAPKTDDSDGTDSSDPANDSKPVASDGDDDAQPSTPVKRPRKRQAKQVQVQDEPADEGTGMSRPNALSIELLGRGALYSIDYDRSITSWLGVGVGFSYWGASDQGVTFAAALIPAYVNLYLAPGPSRVYLTGGADFVYVSANVQNYVGIAATGALGTAGIGWEYRGDGGFLFRVTPYVLFGSGGVQAWGGVSFGYAF